MEENKQEPVKKKKYLEKTQTKIRGTFTLCSKRKKS